MRITIEIPDEEVHRVLAPLLAREAVPVPGTVPEKMPALMQMGDAAKQLAISRNSLYQLVVRGEIPSVKIGRSIRIPTESLASFIRNEAQRRKEEKNAALDQWKDWANRPRVARPPVAASMSSLPRVKARPKPSRKQIDLTPKPRPNEPRGWTREDQLGVLKSMEEGGWPTELTALMLQDWDSGVRRTYVIRAADLAQLLKISRSTADAMIKRGQIPSFSPEPTYRNERRETLVSVLDYQRFVGDHPMGGQEGTAVP